MVYVKKLKGYLLKFNQLIFLFFFKKIKTIKGLFKLFNSFKSLLIFFTKNMLINQL